MNIQIKYDIDSPLAGKVFPVIGEGIDFYTIKMRKGRSIKYNVGRVRKSSCVIHKQRTRHDRR